METTTKDREDTPASKIEGESAEKLMQKRIERFNRFVMSQNIDKLPVGLFCGKMGLCIYFYHQARNTGDKHHKKFADKLLESLLSQLNTKSLISLEDGLIGICLGLNYLVEKGFQTGNINHILSELDDKIYHVAWFELLKNNTGSRETIESAIEVALYFTIRLQNEKLDKNTRFLFESVVIKSINQIESSYSYYSILSEPSIYSLNQYLIVNYLYLLSLVYDLEFYNYKITKILDELYPKIAFTYPLLQANRLHLISVLEVINSQIKSDSYNHYTNRLKQELDVQNMIAYEFKNKSLLLANGMCGMYLVQGFLFKNNKFPDSLLIDRIVESDLWQEIHNDGILNASLGLFTGLAGIILTYQCLVNKVDL